jgi:protein ImuB
MARCSGQERCLIPPGEESSALAPLPIEALRLDDDTILALRELNIERVGDIYDLPRLELAARFDPLLLKRLDQALGEIDEAVEPLRPVEPPVVQREFSGPVLQLQAITQTVRDLLDELHTILHQREIGVRSLRLHYERIDAPPIEQYLNLSRPSRHVAHLWSLLRPQVESLHLGFGIERIYITAVSTGRLRHQQVEHSGGGVGDADPSHMKRAFAEMIDNLNHRLGPQRVLKAQPVESHLPERAFVHRPIIETALDKYHQCGRSQSMPPKNDAAMSRSDRPSLVFADPEPARVIAMTPDGPITWIHWRGRDHRIIESIGPERIAEQWWGGKPHLNLRSRRSAVAGCGSEGHAISEDTINTSTSVILPPHALRDYFKIQDDRGRWLWLYRQFDTRQWYIHGEWT